MKKVWISSIVCGGLIAGMGITFARSIPGVTKPFNSAAYYSETAISYADSPSAFFYKDLARSGGTVYDPLRKIKSALGEAQFLEIYAAVKEILSYKNRDAAMFEESMRPQLEQAAKDTAKLYQAEKITEKLDTVFAGVKSTDEELTERDARKQAEYLGEVYRTIAETAAESVKNGNERQRILVQAVERSANAGGTAQAKQAESELSVILQTETSERNMLLGNLTAMIGAKQKADMDNELRRGRAARDAITQMQISDPYHPNETDRSRIEQKEPLGFPNF